MTPRSCNATTRLTISSRSFSIVVGALAIGCTRLFGLDGLSYDRTGAGGAIGIGGIGASGTEGISGTDGIGGTNGTDTSGAGGTSGIGGGSGGTSGIGGQDLDPPTAGASGEAGTGGSNARVEHHLGWIPDSPELVLSKMMPVIATPATPSPLPARLDLSPTLPPVADQDQQESSVAWAVGYYLKTFHEAVEMSWDPARSLYEFSPSWLYNQVNSGVDSGASIATTMDLVVAQGSDTAVYFPYDSADWVKQPDGASFARAARFKAEGWSTIAVSEQNLKQVLASGNLVVAGVQVFPDFDQLSVANPVYDSSAGTSRGGQAIVLFGYDDEKKAFRFRNQWGETWGDHGDGWLAYTLASEPELGMVAYVMTDASNSPPPVRDNLYLINQGSLLLVDKYFGDSRLALNTGLSGPTSMTALNGGLYVVEHNKLNKATPDTNAYRILGSSDWTGLTQTAVSGTTLYAVHNSELLAVDSSDGTRTIAASGDWNGATSIAGLNNVLYLLQNGALSKVDPLQGSSVELGSTIGPGQHS